MTLITPATAFVSEETNNQSDDQTTLQNVTLFGCTINGTSFLYRCQLFLGILPESTVFMAGK
jgi:hypothetical protein